MAADISRQPMVASFLQQDWYKIERLVALHESTGLPIHHYLCLESTHFTPDAAEVQAYFAAQQETRFALRAIPSHPDGKPGRTLGLSREECFAYLDHLTCTGGKYLVYLWDYFLPECNGTIIITPHGLYAELVRGSHLLLTQQAVKTADLTTASLTFPHYHMVYSTDDMGIRTVLWHAIVALIRETSEAISPLTLPIFLKGYFEFSFHPARGYRFFDSNNHPFIARIPCSETFPAILG